MIRKRFKKFKKMKKVKELVPDTVIERASNLNPLTPPKPEEPLSLENVPQITNETIAEHREDVLSGARKYIYPLQHSKHRIVVITTTIMVGASIAFLIYCVLGLYRFYQSNTFLYRVTQVIPFPIARVGGNFVDYENYLFQLRHYVFYYQTQQQANLNDPNYKQQLLNYRKVALADTINNAYVKKLAGQNHVSVSDKEVDERMNEVREQNRLGSNNKVFADVLHSYFNWSINDFKRSLKDEILAEKVAAKLDKDATSRANSALAAIKTGTDFGSLAKQVSDDPSSKPSGGDYGFGITQTNANVPPQIIKALFSLKAGQVSDVILASPTDAAAPPTLEIIKVTQTDGTTVTAQHIVFKLKDLSTYIKPLEAKTPPKTYVHL